MERKIEINYSWECDQGIDIPQKHEEALKEDAENRIFEMIKEGYRQGELNTSVRYGKDIVPEEDEDDGLTYSGWWSVSYGVKLPVMHCFVVAVHGCDDSTIFDMEMTEQEFEFLQKVAKLTTETSTYGCMPILVVEPK